MLQILLYISTMVVSRKQTLISSTVHRREKLNTKRLTGPYRTVSPCRIPQGKLPGCSAPLFASGITVQTKKTGKAALNESSDRILFDKGRRRLLPAGSRRAERQEKEKKENHESGL